MSRMWACSGGNHRGVCLEFDKTEFLNENQSFLNADLLRSINYFLFDIKKEYKYKTVNHIEMEKIGKEKYIREVFRPANLEHLYFTKNKEWESEAEIRLVHFSRNPSDEYCSIKKSLKNIYLGVDFDDNNVQTLIDLCPNVDIHKLKFHEVRMAPELIYEGKNNYDIRHNNIRTRKDEPEVRYTTWNKKGLNHSLLSDLIQVPQMIERQTQQCDGFMVMPLGMVGTAL